LRIELSNPTFSSGTAPEKLIFAEVSWEGIGGDVAEVAEEIIRETCKELDIEVK